MTPRRKPRNQSGQNVENGKREQGQSHRSSEEMQGGTAAGNDESAVVVESKEGLQIEVSVSSGKYESANVRLESGQESEVDDGFELVFG